MKKIITLALATATLFAFSSCQKENLTNTSNNGVRVITGTFENNSLTKTTLNSDGKTPEWAVGDVIRVLNATSYQDVTLEAGNISGNKITFTTTLTGTLYAVYPASVTTMESCGDGNITFTIPAVQDGTFASANICVAKSSTTDETNKDNLMFCNATAVLAFSQTAVTNKVLGVRVEAANAIVGPMTVGFKADGTLDTPTTSSLSGQLIRVKSSEAKDKYYIAAAPVATGRIEFEYQQAIKVATVTTEAGKTLAVNIIYACPSMDDETYEVKKGTINGHDYVQIGSVKWATMNIGATTITGPTGYGDYFAWGAAEKAYSDYSSYTFTFLSSRPSSYGTGDWDMDQGFCYKNTPYYDATGVYSKYTGSDSKYVLEPMDDAAHCIWESTWRMPTGGAGGEFDALCKATYWKWDDTDEGYYVYVPNPSADAGKYNGNGTGEYDKSDALLFFPSAYQGDGCDNWIWYWRPDVEGFYWTSTLGNPSEHANFLHFTKGAVAPNNGSFRYFGCSIRPVSD